MLKKIMELFLTIKELEFQKNEINDCLFVTGGKLKPNQIFLTESLDVQLLIWLMLPLEDMTDIFKKI